MKLVIDVVEFLWDEIECYEKCMMFLVISFVKLFILNGYGNWFWERCWEVGLLEWCILYGLRKVVVKDFVEVGCIMKEI